jgi:hypothetical protein
MIGVKQTSDHFALGYRVHVLSPKLRRVLPSYFMELTTTTATDGPADVACIKVCQGSGDLSVDLRTGLHRDPAELVRVPPGLPEGMCSH